MSLRTLFNSYDPASYSIVSTDLFDTVLLRDLSSESARFNEAAIRAAAQLHLDPKRLSALRRSFHSIAYKAVAVERPLGDASLAAIYQTIADAMGCDRSAAITMAECEVSTDIRHLSPNRPLLRMYDRLAGSGKMIIATTDTYYSGAEIKRILDEVIGRHPISRVYASSDLGWTKHAGGLFAEVGRREAVTPARMLHFGDDPIADVRKARAAGWQALHLPRATRWRRVGKFAVSAANYVRSDWP